MVLFGPRCLIDFKEFRIDESLNLFLEKIPEIPHICYFL